MTEKRPSLLIVGAFPPPSAHLFGGIISSCHALLQSSLPRRFQLTLVDSTAISNPSPVLPIRAMYALKRMLTYFIRLEQTRPDAVLLFASSGGSLIEKGLMAHYAQLRGIPVLIFPQSGRILHYLERSCLHRWAVYFALIKPTRVLCQGEQWQAFIVDKLNRSIHVAPLLRSWTATPKLLSIGAQRVHTPPNAKPRLLFVGWLDRAKGVLDLLTAIKCLPNNLKPELDLVGEGDVSTTARQYVKEHKLNKQVRFRGWLIGEDLLDAYRTADMFVLPSWFEGLPNAMIEAMAARLTIIVSNVGNIPSVVVDGKNGILIPPKRADILTEVLQNVLTDTALRHQLANHAYRTASKQFGVERAVQDIAHILQDVTGIPVPSAQ